MKLKPFFIIIFQLLPLDVTFTAEVIYNGTVNYTGNIFMFEISLTYERNACDAETLSQWKTNFIITIQWHDTAVAINILLSLIM